MLVLRRRAGESLLIGDDIEIEVLAVSAQGRNQGAARDRHSAQRAEDHRETE